MRSRGRRRPQPQPCAQSYACWACLSCARLFSDLLLRPWLFLSIFLDLLGYEPIQTLDSDQREIQELIDCAQNCAWIVTRLLVRLTMSVRLLSGRLIRYIPGHFGSAAMRGFMFGGLRGCLSVTPCVFCSSEIPMVAVTLRNASGATLGRVGATLVGVPRSRVRCAAFRQRGLQNRAVERCNLNCAPQAAHSLGLFLVRK